MRSERNNIHYISVNPARIFHNIDWHPWFGLVRSGSLVWDFLSVGVRLRAFFGMCCSRAVAWIVFVDKCRLRFLVWQLPVGILRLGTSLGVLRLGTFVSDLSI